MCTDCSRSCCPHRPPLRERGVAVACLEGGIAMRREEGAGPRDACLDCWPACHAMPRHAMPCHATPRHAMPRRIMPCYAMPRHAMPCHATPAPCHVAAPAHVCPAHAAMCTPSGPPHVCPDLFPAQGHLHAGAAAAQGSLLPAGPGGALRSRPGSPHPAGCRALQQKQ